MQTARSDAPVPPFQVGLEHIILARVCWSTDPSVATPYEGDLHRGVWAGDRFTITTLERLEVEVADFGEVWKDASEDVIKELDAIFSAEGVDIRSPM